MLSAAAATTTSRFNELDQRIFAELVPQDHYLRSVAAAIDFERFRPTLEKGYSNLGRPGIDPILMLKFSFLSFHYRLSDRMVILRSATDVAFRWFLGLSCSDSLPHHTDATYFRRRHADRLPQVFQDLLGIARDHGLVSDRLRLKDATHVLADAAQMTPLALAATVRERLLHAAEPLFADWVAQQQKRLLALRQTSAELPDDERLAGRVEFLRGLADDLRQRVGALPEAERSSSPACQRLQRAMQIAAKLLQDHADPQAGDRLAGAADPDARVGMHGGFFFGYLFDMAMDPESELITAVDVLPGNAAGNGAEAANAAELIRQEEAAQGNDVEGMSIDGAGHNGRVLRELTDPEGLDLEVTVPVPAAPARQTYGPERFELTVLEGGGGELKCPAGQTTRQRERNEDDTGWKYSFKGSQCAGCPLRAECLQNPGGEGKGGEGKRKKKKERGRKVTKNDYEKEYGRARQKVGTAEYERVRKEHPKVERKLGEVARHHGMRRARYRGRGAVLVQAVLTALAVNVKRMVKLLADKVLGSAARTETVRAEVCVG